MQRHPTSIRHRHVSSAPPSDICGVAQGLWSLRTAGLRTGVRHTRHHRDSTRPWDSLLGSQVWGLDAEQAISESEGASPSSLEEHRHYEKKGEGAVSILDVSEMVRRAREKTYNGQGQKLIDRAL